LLFFFAEGSAVTIYKTLQAVISTQYVFSADDQAAMGWLQTHAHPGEMVINDAATDAGIWAPYKANLPILLPRSAGGALVADRAPILSNLLVLDHDGSLASRACALHADYVFAGSRSVPDDQPLLPARPVLEQTPHLEEVFASGNAAVFRMRLDCDQG
jgi:hypothetical protein